MKICIKLIIVNKIFWGYFIKPGSLMAVWHSPAMPHYLSKSFSEEQAKELLQGACSP